MSMEIYNPEEIKVSNSLGKTLRFIQSGIQELNDKDLTEIDRKKILEALMVPHISKSLSIEDIRATARQTKDVLDFYKLNREVKEGKGNQEIVNLQDANDLICSKESISLDLSQSFIKQVHYELTKNTKVENPGSFKTKPNQFREDLVTAMPLVIPELIDSICIYFEASFQQDPIVLACWLHHQIAKIHPFADGNGRTARTLQDWVLYKNKYLPCSTGTISRIQYYNMLEDADSGDWEHLIEQVAQAQSDSLAIAMQIIESSESSKRRRNLLLDAFKSKKTKVDDQEYLTWRYQASLLINSFEQECIKFNDQLKELDTGYSIQFISQDLISRDSWNIIKSDGFANKNNAFVMIFYKDRVPFYKTIAYFAKHFRRDSDKSIPLSNTDLNTTVVLYMGGHDEPPNVDLPPGKLPFKSKRLTNHRTGAFITELPWDDERIAVREVFFDSRSFYKFRYTTRWIREEYLKKGLLLDFDADGYEHWVVDETQPDDVASEYIYDILYYKGGLETD